MIVVDTTIWIEFFRGRNRPVAEHLRELLDRDEVALAAPVRVEILGGARLRDFDRLRRLLSALPIFYPTDAAWRRIDEWVERAVAAGDRFGVGDLLIGAIAAERAAAVWSLDSDFARMARFGWIQLHEPSRSPP